MIARPDNFAPMQHIPDPSLQRLIEQLEKQAAGDDDVDNDSGYESDSDNDIVDKMPAKRQFVSRNEKRQDGAPPATEKPPATGEKTAAPPPPAATSGQQTPEAQQTAKDGNSTDLPDPNEKAPPGMTVDQIKALNGGVLGKMGDQQVRKDGKDMGKLPDVLANDPKVKGGDDKPKADLNNDPDAAWRAYRVLTAVKNEKNKDGSEKPEDYRHNGNIGGYTSKGDAAGGSEAGSLQDYLAKGRVPTSIEPQKDPHAGKNGSTASGAEVVGNSIKYGFEKVGNAIKQGFVDFGHAVVKLGKDIGSGFKHFGEMVKHGLTGLGAAIRGDKQAKDREWSQARDNGHALGDDIKDGAKQVGTIAETVVPLALNFVPGVGTAASIGVMAVKTGVQVGVKVAVETAAKETVKAGAKATAEGIAKETAKTAAKTGAKEGGKAAAKEAAKELAKAGLKAGGKSLAKDAGQQFYTGATGETPQETARRLYVETTGKTPKQTVSDIV